MKQRHIRKNYLFQLNMERNLLEAFGGNLLDDNWKAGDEVLSRGNLNQALVVETHDENLNCCYFHHSSIEEGQVWDLMDCMVDRVYQNQVLRVVAKQEEVCCIHYLGVVYYSCYQMVAY